MEAESAAVLAQTVKLKQLNDTLTQQQQARRSELDQEDKKLQTDYVRSCCRSLPPISNSKTLQMLAGERVGCERR